MIDDLEDVNDLAALLLQASAKFAEADKAFEEAKKNRDAALGEYGDIKWRYERACRIRGY